MYQELVRVYAIRAREFSDTVARLGQHKEIGAELLDLLKEIERRHDLCVAAARALDGYIEQGAFESQAGPICAVAAAPP
jgi:hypothetical protein